MYTKAYYKGVLVNDLQYQYSSILNKFDVASIYANGEQGFWFDPNDLSTMFQDAAGTVPVTAAGQPVGLWLDKSKGLVLGGELTVNGDFSNGVNSWISVDGFGTATNANMTVSNGVMTCTGNNGVKLAQGQSLIAGRWYYLECEVLSASTSISLHVSESSDLTTVQFNDTFSQTIGKRRLIFLASTRTKFIGIRCNNAGVFSVDNFRLKELAGNHAYQTTSASRPILRQTSILGSELVVNGDFTSDFSGWVKSGNVNADVVSGTLKLTNTSGGNAEQVSQGLTLKPSTRYRLSCTAYRDTTATLFRVLIDTNLSTIGSVQSSTTTKSELFFEFTTPASFTSVSVRLRIEGIDGSAYFDNVTIKEITGYYTNKNYLVFDGVDDFLVTNNVDFTTTDKVSLFAGVRKLSDSTTGVVAELSASADSNKATFALLAPSESGARHYNFRSHGTYGDWSGTATFTNRPAPSSDILTCTGSISTDVCELTVNSGNTYNNTVDQGSGNYGNYPLYVGRRGGTILPFNGHIYGLIGVGILTNKKQTINIEKMLAKKIGVVLNV